MAPSFAAIHLNLTRGLELLYLAPKRISRIKNAAIYAKRPTRRKWLVWDIETARPILLAWLRRAVTTAKAKTKFAAGANYQSTFTTRFVRFGALHRSDRRPFPSF